MGEAVGGQEFVEGKKQFPLAFCKGAFSEVLQLEVIVVTPVSFMLICFLSPQNTRHKALQPLST